MYSKLLFLIEQDMYMARFAFGSSFDSPFQFYTIRELITLGIALTLQFAKGNVAFGSLRGM